MMRGVFTMEGLNIRYVGGRRYLEGWEAVATSDSATGGTSFRIGAGSTRTRMRSPK
jgi:hypothetical protein